MKKGLLLIIEGHQAGKEVARSISYIHKPDIHTKTQRGVGGLIHIRVSVFYVYIHIPWPDGYLLQQRLEAQSLAHSLTHNHSLPPFQLN